MSEEKQKTIDDILDESIERIKKEITHRNRDYWWCAFVDPNGKFIFSAVDYNPVEAMISIAQLPLVYAKRITKEQFEALNVITQQRAERRIVTP